MTEEENTNKTSNTIKSSISNINMDLTEPAIKITNELINDKNKALKKVGFLFDFLTAKIKPYMYGIIKESEMEIKEIDKKFNDKYDKIPDENRIMPRANIIVPTSEALLLNINEEYIRNMFINLMINEVDNRKQNNVRTAFIEIINQLDHSDAKLIQELSSYIIDGKSEFSICLLRNGESSKKFTEISSILCTKNEIKELDEIVINNLERLGIIKVMEDYYIQGENELLEEALKKAKSQYPELNNLFYDKAVLSITKLGINFIKICCEC